MSEIKDEVRIYGRDAVSHPKCYIRHCMHSDPFATTSSSLFCQISCHLIWILRRGVSQRPINCPNSRQCGSQTFGWISGRSQILSQLSCSFWAAPWSDVPRPYYYVFSSRGAVWIPVHTNTPEDKYHGTIHVHWARVNRQQRSWLQKIHQTRSRGVTIKSIRKRMRVTAIFPNVSIPQRSPGVFNLKRGEQRFQLLWFGSLKNLFYNYC